MNPVAITALLVAALRAEESKRADRLFDDPFAEALAGPDGFAILAKSRASGGPSVPIIEVRTHWYDAAVVRMWSGRIRQFVLLAAGMDTRAYRLQWPEESRVFEIDQPDIITRKEHVLAGHTPRCRRVAIAIDLASDWPTELNARGFDPAVPTGWLVEGLAQYLPGEAVAQLFSRIDALSAPGSIALYDVVGQSLLESPQSAAMLQLMRELGAPWLFGSDEPQTLLPTWQATVTDPAVAGNALKRWPFPAPAPEARNVPRGNFVEAHKR